MRPNDFHIFLGGWHQLFSTPQSSQVQVLERALDAASQFWMWWFFWGSFDMSRQWILGYLRYIHVYKHVATLLLNVLFLRYYRWVWKIWLDVPEYLGQGGGNSGYFFEGPLCTELKFSLATVSCGEGLRFSGALDATWSLSCYDFWKWGTSTIAEIHGYLLPSLVASNSWIGRFPLQRFTAGFNLQAAKLLPWG